jgi:hypothetical protein
MTWVLWRQHRMQLYVAAASLAALAVLLGVTGAQMASQYHEALLACAPTSSCGNLANDLSLGSPVLFTVVTLTAAVPALLGLFWGAPLVARELETGTDQYIWMQTITRRHWSTVKITALLLATLAFSGAVAALVTWWSSPVNALDQNRFDPSQFDVQGIVPIGYALFAAALGLCAGTVLRRSLPALAVTLVVFAGVRILTEYFLRPRYMPAVTRTFPLGSPTFPAGSFWRIDQGTIGAQGQAQSGKFLGDVSQMPAACRDVLGQGPRNVLSCLSAHGYRGYLTYQPADRYWTFQGIETGIFVLLAAALVATAVTVLLHRDA